MPTHAAFSHHFIIYRCVQCKIFYIITWLCYCYSYHFT